MDLIQDPKNRNSDATKQANALWIEPFGGIAGDMLIAALLDLGADGFALSDLEELGERLLPGAAKLSSEKVKRSGFAATLFQVDVREAPALRHLKDLQGLVRKAGLDSETVERACAVFLRLAEAEAKVHGSTIERVHFHEVGAVDTLIDVTAACWAWDRLGLSAAFASPPLLGQGTVQCEHGLLPVPAPGTAELLRGRQTRAGGSGERTTPTGAALLAELTLDAAPVAFRSFQLGYGAGQREAQTPEDAPNLCRVQWGTCSPDASPNGRSVWQLECNLDDASPERVGYAVGQLRKLGALEVWTSALQMKKDRPGVLLSLLCEEAQRPALEANLFANSPTLGVRAWPVQRNECERELLELEVAGRRFRVKLRRRVGAAVGRDDFKVEFDDLAAACESTGEGWVEWNQQVLQAVWAQQGL